MSSEATCRVCGERVSMVEAPLHIEDHAQAGELPASLPGSAPEPGDNT